MLLRINDIIVILLYGYFRINRINDGSGTDGSGTYGSGTDGSGTDGSGTDGSGTDMAPKIYMPHKLNSCGI